MSFDAYSEFTIPQLKEQCEARGIAPSTKRPKKAEWIETLMADDKAKAAAKPTVAAAAAPAAAPAAAVVATPVKAVLKDVTNAQPKSAAKPVATAKPATLAPAPTPAPTPIKPVAAVTVAATPLSKLVQQLAQPLYPELGVARETEIAMKWDVDALTASPAKPAAAPAAATTAPVAGTAKPVMAAPTGKRVKFVYNKEGKLLATQHLLTPAAPLTNPIAAAEAANADADDDADVAGVEIDAADEDVDAAAETVERMQMSAAQARANGFLPPNTLQAGAISNKRVAL